MLAIYPAILDPLWNIYLDIFGIFLGPPALGAL